MISITITNDKQYHTHKHTERGGEREGEREGYLSDLESDFGLCSDSGGTEIQGHTNKYGVVIT